MTEIFTKKYTLLQYSKELEKYWNTTMNIRMFAASPSARVEEFKLTKKVCHLVKNKK